MVLTSFFLICSFNFQILNFCLFLLFGKCRNRMFPFGYDFTTACGVYSLTMCNHLILVLIYISTLENLRKVSSKIL